MHSPALLSYRAVCQPYLIDYLNCFDFYSQFLIFYMVDTSIMYILIIRALLGHIK